MNTKEAIKYIESEKIPIANDSYGRNIKIDEIVDLLKCGERYEAMWDELDSYREVLVTPKCFITKKYIERSLGTVMYDIEQKYFPKSMKKTITIDKDLLSDHAREINKCYREWIEDHLVRDLPITPEGLAILSDSIIKGIENTVKNIKEGD